MKRIIGLVLFLLWSLPAFAHIYSTNFPLPENPISEGGNWVNGGTCTGCGVDWNNIKTTSGYAQQAAPGNSGEDDGTAILKGTWGASQTVIITGRNPDALSGQTQEIEIRLRSTMTPNSSTGYEIDFTTGNTDIVRWNGPSEDFTVLGTIIYRWTDHASPILKATMVGSLITVYDCTTGTCTTLGTATDSTYTTGNPGFGIDDTNNTGTQHNFGISKFVTYDGAQTPLDLDTFNGSNATALHTYDSKWNAVTDYGDLKIEGTPGVGFFGADYNNGQTWTNDQFAQLTIGSTVPDSEGWIVLRAQTPGAGNGLHAYMCGADPHDYNGIYRVGYWTQYAYTNLATGTATMTAGDVLNCQISGTVITLTVTRSLAVVDTVVASDGSNTYTSGNVGLKLVNSVTNVQLGTFWSAGSVAGCTPAKLAFTSQPAGTTLGSPIGTISVAVEDSGGSVCSSATNAITLSKHGGATWGTLTAPSTLTHNAATGVGVATWTDATVITTTGSGSIDAAASGLTTATSNSFTMTPQVPITTASCSLSDVSTQINGPTHVAIDGDVIIISATGSPCTWNAGIAVPAGIGITIMGVGSPGSSPAVTGADASCSAVTIIDNDLLTGAATNLFVFEPILGNSLTRLSCIYLKSSNAGPQTIHEPISVGGTCTATPPYCPNLRLDNLSFDPNFQDQVKDSALMIVVDNIYGVVDHNTTVDGTYTGVREFINFNNSAWHGVGGFGDNSWHSAPSFGTAENIFVENNYFGIPTLTADNEEFGPLDPVGGESGRGAGRIVLRFNNCPGCSITGISMHGTDSNARNRGGQEIEVYGNTFNCINILQGCGGVMTIRSGYGMAFGNNLTVTSPAFWSNYMSWDVGRIGLSFPPFGVCDGSGLFDNNDGVTYFSGTMSNVTKDGVSTTTFADAGGFSSFPNLIPTGAPYAVHVPSPHVTDTVAYNSLVGAFVVSNTSTTVSAFNTGTGGDSTPPPFTAGGINTFTVAGTATGSASQTFVAQGSTSGSGLGALFNVTESGGSYIVTVSAGNSGISHTLSSYMGNNYAAGNTITILGANLGGSTPANNLTITVTGTVSDTYQILRASACLDQPGRSQGTLYSGGSGNTPPTPASAANQVLTPSYEWDDSGPMTQAGANYGKNVVPGPNNPAAPQLIENRDWYSDNALGTPHVQTSSSSPFNGTVGVGFGTKANRPSTCTTGVGYWAYDEGSWNTGGRTYTGGYSQGNLYICVASAWPGSPVYTPYNYPHPLTVNNSCLPDHFAFTAQPASAVVGASLGTVSVAVEDSSNNICSSATDSITLAAHAGATWASLVSGSTLTKSAVSGIATWTDLSVTPTAGSGSIDATGDVTTATSNSITISTPPCTPSKVVFTSQPSGAFVGSPLGTIRVAVQDSGGNTCNDTSTVTLSKHTGTCLGMTLNPTFTGAAVAGVFTTTTANLTGATGACQVDAADGVLTGATSNSFNISVSASNAAAFRVRSRAHH